MLDDASVTSTLPPRAQSLLALLAQRRFKARIGRGAKRSDAHPVRGNPVGGGSRRAARDDFRTAAAGQSAEIPDEFRGEAIDYARRTEES